VEGNVVSGTASFLGVRRGIVNGSLTDDRVVFETRTEEITGERDRAPVEHHYRGTIAGDTIAFTMQSDGGSSTLPIEFTARRD
jgi:hypothetical protein